MLKLNKRALNLYDSNGKRHGIWESYYENGSLWWRNYYLHGEHHGTWEGYQADGTLKWREHWLHGKLHGLKQWYYSYDIPDEKVYYLRIK